ncbi:hypothetical protein HYH02_006593 [Chlamydomonas schloesseri]|uniref:C2 domain-containing protein n=1 Tax=Chlamydomonas schloesseri TaxID=2026947 RepID=A0A835T7W3_9CHLO|nr:hypothetical protein HYH02_006593 [Chlamydomonas schloesseri]|eukprot:KAG2439066.1 hypothetical protein HYH02_006593 [Chlamydomonas schloesseri]
MSMLSYGGRDPVWNETFSFDVHHASQLEVTIKDDKLLHDPTLGVACVSLSRAREHGGDRLTAEVICPHHHCQHGTISLVLAFKPHAQQLLVAAVAPAYPSPPPPSAAVQGVPVPVPVPVHVLPPPPPPVTVVMPVPVYHAPPPPRVVVVDVCEPHHHHHHGLFHHHHHHHGHHHHHHHHHHHGDHHHWC